MHFYLIAHAIVVTIFVDADGEVLMIFLLLCAASIVLHLPPRAGADAWTSSTL
jgi:hypothetical protein